MLHSGTGLVDEYQLANGALPKRDEVDAAIAREFWLENAFYSTEGSSKFLRVKTRMGMITIPLGLGRLLCAPGRDHRGGEAVRHGDERGSAGAGLGQVQDGLVRTVGGAPVARQVLGGVAGCMGQSMEKSTLISSVESNASEGEPSKPL